MINYKSADIPRSALPLTGQYTNSTASIGSNHCYRNYPASTG